MASEFKLNPGATEFVPCFGHLDTIPNADDATSQLDLSSREKCSQKQVISSVEDENVDRSEHPCEGSTDTPIQPQVVIESLAGYHHEMIERANAKSCDLVRTSRKDSSTKSSTRTLPRIASGENLADFELDFHEMILQSPCDKPNCPSNQDDLNPLQIWCGEEPPQLVWSRSTDNLELTDEIGNQEEGSDEQITEPCGNAEAEALKRSQKQSRTTISSRGEESDTLATKVEEEEETTGEDPVQQTKSKITVDDFEILCMVGEVQSRLYVMSFLPFTTQFCSFREDSERCSKSGRKTRVSFLR